MGYKDRIQRRAEELAMELHGEEFYELSQLDQLDVYERARKEVIENYRDSIREKRDR